MSHEPQNQPATDDEVPTDRSIWITAREIAATTRDQELTEREELIRLREAALEARREADDARAEREQLLGQIRDVNERLITAIVEAHQLADDANAARVTADHNEERFRSLVYTSSSIVWHASADGRLQIDPKTWRAFTGVEPGPDEWGWLEAVHPLDQSRVRGAWAGAVSEAKPFTCQHRIRSSGGGYAWVVARAVPIPSTGAVREWIGMITDVSDRVRIEQAREQFIGILGHDLRNPLSAILMGVELLSELPEPHKGTVARVGRSAHRIEAMIGDLLDFARGRLAGGIPITPRSCDLRVVCDEVVQEMAQAYPDHKIAFEAAGDLRGEWDPDRVEQVVSNLVGNALSHGAGRVHVIGRGGGDEVVLTVHNRGTPIPAAVLPTLFEPFKRPVDGAHGKGLGLGLYIASEIVQAHRGTLSVTSTNSDGTTFTVTWPRRAQRPLVPAILEDGPELVAARP